MSAIWGHVESIVNQPKYPSIMVLNMRTPLETRHLECIVGLGTRVQKGFARLNLDEIRPGDFVVANLAEHSGHRETERIDVIIKFETIR